MKFYTSTSLISYLLPFDYHWSQRMERYLKRLGRDVWRSVEEGPHVLILTPIQADGAQVRLGGG